MVLSAINISGKKGTVKKEVNECEFKSGFGIAGDAHGGSSRPVSILLKDEIDRFIARTGYTVNSGAFGENLIIDGLNKDDIYIGLKIRVGEALLEVIKLGKQCHDNNCIIKKNTGECIMPECGFFCNVLISGSVKKGMEVSIA
ncbi:MAG: MOSC domain-containing protein [Actinomycetia bacterium]|nr:MOSC domain-containing protein [Actinomycetes bacterium]